MITLSHRPLPDNTQHSQQTNIHAPGGVRTHNLSRRSAADLRLRPCGHWDRRCKILLIFNTFCPPNLDEKRKNNHAEPVAGLPGQHFEKCFSEVLLEMFCKLHLFSINPLNAKLNPICHLLALLGVHHFLHVSRIRVKSLTLRQLMSYIWSTYS